MKNTISIKKVKNLHYIFMGFIVLVYCLLGIYYNNPDSDSYFLITTGKYIVENRALPEYNVWTWHENFGIIVQQWIACILNYCYYNIAGDAGLMLMALVNTIISNIIAWKYTGLYTSNKHERFIALLAFNFIMKPYMNSRPTILTVSYILFELITLTEYSRDKLNIRQYILRMSVVSLLLVNWHSSFWLLSFVMILPFMTPAIWDIKNTDWKKTLNYSLAIIPMIITGMINPNGFKAFGYFLNSYGSISTQVVISELVPPTFGCIFGIVIIILITMITYYIAVGDRNKELIYLSLGTILLASMHLRNNWLLVFMAMQLLIWVQQLLLRDKDKDFETSRLLHTVILFAYTITGFILTIVMLSMVLDHKANEKYYIPTKAIEYLNGLDKNEIILYNEFATGNYLALKGYKVYIDARPELYTPEISGVDDNIYQEYVDILTGKADYEQVLNNRNFTHLVVNSNSYLDLYLSCQDDYILKVASETYKLYERQ